MTAAPYCGDPAIRFGLGRADPSGGLPALFAGRRVAFGFKTRVAIRKACDLLGLKPGDEVLAPAWNCGSELDPLRHAGLTVTLYAVDGRGRADPDAVAARIGPATRAVYLTHYFGFLQPETAGLRALCDRHGLALIEDCALSLLSGARPAEGRTGDVAVFCLYKFFPVLGGGALVANDPRIVLEGAFPNTAPAAMVGKALLRGALGAALGPGRAAALLGAVRGRHPPSDPPSAGDRADMPAHYYFDPRLRDAGLARVTARAIAGFDVPGAIAARRTNYARMLDRLDGLPGAAPVFPALDEGAVPLAFPVLVAGPARPRVVAALQAEGIAATPWWSGYNRHLDFAGQPDACRLKDGVVSLPVHQYLGPEAIDHIAGRFRAHLARATA
jgi:perosamine synthetase